MKVKVIRQIVNLNIDDTTTRTLILKEISKSDDAVEDLMTIIDQKNKRNKSLINELNLLVSKSHLTLKYPDLDEKDFTIGQIEDFYKDNNEVGHLFNQ